MKGVKPTDVFPLPAEDVDRNLPPVADLRQPEFVSLYRFSYLGDLMRVDDPIAMTAVIKRPDLHELIFLNLFKRTYYIVKAAPSASPSPQPSLTPAAVTVNYQVLESGEILAPAIIEGKSSTGYRGVFSIATLNGTKKCPSFSFTMTWTQYTANEFEAPVLASLPTPPPPSDGCTFAEPSISTDARIFTNLILYRSLVLEAPAGFELSSKRLIGWSALPYARVEEDGNVARLGAADKALFDIPAGFAPGQ
jgi:hypothetical protein